MSSALDTHPRVILEVHCLANEFKDTHLARHCITLTEKVVDDDNVAEIAALSLQLKLSQTFDLALEAIAESERLWTLHSEELKPLIHLLEDDVERIEKLKISIWKSGRHGSPSPTRAHLGSPRASSRSHAPVREPPYFIIFNFARILKIFCGRKLTAISRFGCAWKRMRRSIISTAIRRFSRVAAPSSRVCSALE